MAAIDEKIEIELVARLRNTFKPELETYPDLNTRWNLTRFCRARNYDPEKTEVMLRDYFKWRKTKNIQAICTIPLDVFQPLIDAHEIGLYGTTKDGRPIIIERLGYSDINEILDPKYDNVREDYLLRLYEGLFTIVFPIASRIVGKRVEQLFIIYDAKNVNISKLFDKKFQQFVKFMIATVQDYYPELLGKLFIVNAPLLLRSAWAMIKPWLDKKTKNKIEIHSGVPIKALSKYADIKSLPTYLGGENMTPLKDNHGPWKKYVDEAFQRKTFIMEDRTPEFEYFYTEEEKQEALKRIEMNNFYGVHEENKMSEKYVISYQEICIQEVKVMDAKLINHCK